MYSWDYLNAHFIVLNEYYDNGDDDYTSGGWISDDTYNWLVEDLRSNTKQLIFVFGHEPAYPNYRHIGGSLDRPGSMRNEFWELLNDNKVAAYFCGHTHFYYRRKVGGIGYNWEPFTWQIDVGHAGNKSSSEVNPASGPTEDGLTFADITVTDAGVQFDVWREPDDVRGSGISPHFDKDDPWALLDLAIKVRSSEDDAEEWDQDGNSNDGQMDLTSSDLELVYDGHNQMVGIRFQDVRIPQGADIEEAYIQFAAKGPTTSGSCQLTIKGQKSANALAFTTARYNISDTANRPRTTASVDWNLTSTAWDWDQQASKVERTPNIPNIKSVIEEIVKQTGPSGWQSGNSLVIIITGTGARRAWSYDGHDGHAPQLYVKVAK